MEDRILKIVTAMGTVSYGELVRFISSEYPETEVEDAIQSLVDKGFLRLSVVDYRNV